MDSSKVEDDIGHQRVNDGDWVCADSQCGNINFARRNSCNRCGKDRGESSKKKKLGQEIGKVAAEKSRGLFSADDWQCSKCGNVNWARRQQCNMCNAPKFGEVEERTGYGGGYNDRGIVEYKERRDDDDDEYDEFGRRKKKRKLERSDDDSKDSTKYTPPRKISADDKLAATEDPLIHGDTKNNHDRSNSAERRNDNGGGEGEGREEEEQEEEQEVDGEEEDEEAEKEEEEDDEEEDGDGDLSKYDLSEWDDFVPEKKR